MPRLLLVDREPNEPAPALSVYALDAAMQPIAAAPVDERGGFTLPEDAVKKAALIGIGARQEKPPPRLNRDELVLYRRDQLLGMLGEDGVLELARARWTALVPLFPRCVTGRVRRCHWWPWWLMAQDIAISAVQLAPTSRLAAEPAFSDTLRAGAASPRFGSAIQLLPPPWFHRCATVCEGVVEVYQRICCWTPIIIQDPRIPEIIRRLEELVLVERIPRFPPIPNPPDPPPFALAERLFKDGALDEAAFNAPRDLAALRVLPPVEQAAYIEARTYLRHLLHCGTPSKVGQGFIQPDGSFQVCWRALPWFPRPFCHIEVAYVVKQLINGATVTIHDGLASNQWYHLSDTPTLTSYHPKAVGCGGGGVPGADGAVIYLDAVGGTDAYHLKTPAATGWDRVAAPGFNDGLCFPEANALLAKGQMKNCNWGGTLPLRFWFTEPCRAVGVRHYRVGIVPADATGAPVAGATPTYLAPPNGGKWQKLVYGGGGGLDVVSVPLGVAPASVGGKTDLYTIPYDGDLNPAVEEWRDGQFHAELPTTGFDDGRWLLTLEVFDAAGNKLRPQGAAVVPGEPASTERAFSFKRWHAPGTPDVFHTVAHAGLTHMLWWDNRPGVGDILGLRRTGAPTTGECQFLSGPVATTLQVDFIAHHPVSMFQLSHGFVWYRGMSGVPGASAIGVLTPYDNEGTPPTTAAASQSIGFGAMLGPHTACSFALHLNMALKTWNGSGPVYPGSTRDVVAFALSIA